MAYIDYKKIPGVVAGHDRQLRWLNFLVYAFVVMVTIGFITVLITIGGILQENMATRSAAYQDLVNKINEQNIKIDLLYTELKTTNTDLTQTIYDIKDIKTYFGIK
jgi:hypothetical protein